MVKKVFLVSLLLILFATQALADSFFGPVPATPAPSYDMYILKPINAVIEFPESYLVLQKNMSPKDETFEKLGLSPEQAKIVLSNIQEMLIAYTNDTSVEIIISHSYLEEDLGWEQFSLSELQYVAAQNQTTYEVRGAKNFSFKAFVLDSRNYICLSFEYDYGYGNQDHRLYITANKDAMVYFDFHSDKPISSDQESEFIEILRTLKYFK